MKKLIVLVLIKARKVENHPKINKDNYPKNIKV